MPGSDSDPLAGEILTGIARAAIEAEFAPVGPPDQGADWLAEPGASFVTLTRHGRLRGCVGSLTPHRALAQDVHHNAHAAAFRDGRFPRLTIPELGDLAIEVSVLSAIEPLRFGSEQEALEHLRPGIDGLVLRWRDHCGTFLPQLWEQLPERRQFLEHLKHKAGLPADFWREDLRLWRYTVTSWRESGRPLART